MCEASHVVLISYKATVTRYFVEEINICCYILHDTHVARPAKKKKEKRDAS